MEPLQLILIAAALMFVQMTALWFVQRRTGDAGIVDVGWSAGIGILAIIYAIFVDGDPARRALVGGLAAVWSFRLAVYILFNRVIGREEDGRYKMLRANWGDRFQVKMFGFYQAQGVLDVIFSIPPLIVMLKPEVGLGILDMAGALIWCIAVGGEALSDWQLARWRDNPANKGRTCRAGLWRYSRHPNYFFEWVHWWAYVVMAVGAPFWWATLFGPALMLLFLFKITGIPYTEKQAIKSRGDDYRRYQRTTSAFFPWFPKKESVS